MLAPTVEHMAGARGAQGKISSPVNARVVTLAVGVRTSTHATVSCVVNMAAAMLVAAYARANNTSASSVKITVR